MVIPYYNQSLRRDEIEAAGARLVLARDPMPVCPAATTTGEIPFEVDFEPPGPAAGTASSLWCLREGRFEEDKTVDDMALIVNVKDKGLLVITGCAHAGVINTIHHARKITGEQKIYALFGGFHLGFPGIPADKCTMTVEELKGLNPAVVSPMHCSGFRTLAAVQQAMPEAFLLNTAGAQITL